MTSLVRRAQTFLLTLILLVIFVFAGYAVRSTSHPSECEAYASANQATQHIQEEESLWCPSTWTPTTTFTCLLFVATFGLWIFTALLWTSTSRAVADGNEALALGRQEFTASHRPKLRVRHVWTERFGALVTGIGTDGAYVYESGDVLKGSLDVINVGDSRAIVVESYGKTFIFKDFLPTKRPYADEPPNNFLAIGPIEPGGTRNGFFADCSGETAAYSPKVQLGIFVMGWITYVDGNNVPRRTAFCRRYDHANRRFIAVDNPDYEYED